MNPSAPLAYVGPFACRDWTLKLYAPYALLSRDGGDVLAATRRAFAACIAGATAESPVTGFMLLDGQRECRLSAFWWEGAVLCRRMLMLDCHGGPPRRAPDAAERVGAGVELDLISREIAAHRRHDGDDAACMRDIAS